MLLRSIRLMPGDSLNVVLISRSLEAGGAERQMANLAVGLKSKGVNVRVVVFYRGGVFESLLNAFSVEIVSLDKKSRWDLFSPLVKLFSFFKDFKPDFVYSFIGMEVFSLLSKIASPSAKVVWGVRASYLDTSGFSFGDKFYYGLKPWLSRFSDCVISNSEAGRSYAVSRGYRESNFFVVDNGIDVGKFRFDQVSRNRLRSEWNVPSDTTLIGMVARVVRDKDYETFIRAAHLLKSNLGSACPRFVIVGDGNAEYLRELKLLASDLGVSDILIWAGFRSDVASVYSALDVYSLASHGEGFPNTVIEAMSCGLPVVVTDVGDCQRVVGGFGKVVPVKDCSAKAMCLGHYSSPEGRPNRNDVHNYVLSTFSMERMVENTLNVFEKTSLA